MLPAFFRYFSKKKPRFLLIFPFYFLIGLCTSYYGNYLAYHSRTNIPLYNTYNTFEFSFNFFILRSIIRNTRIRRVLLWLIFGFPLLLFLNIHIYKDTTAYSTISYGIGCLLIVFFCILYFVELFQLPKAIDLMKSPAFWICTATLFSYTCSFPFWGMVNLLTVSRNNFNKAYTIVAVINILSYVLFVIAFLCRIRVRKSTSSS